MRGMTKDCGIKLRSGLDLEADDVSVVLERMCWEFNVWGGVVPCR